MLIIPSLPMHYRAIAGSIVPNVINVGLRKWVWAKGVSLHDRSVLVVTDAKALAVFSAR
jgi:hypothetical protein